MLLKGIAIEKFLAATLFDLWQQGDSSPVICRSRSENGFLHRGNDFIDEYADVLRRTSNFQSRQFLPIAVK
jgi:hypothetical protein